MTQASLLTDIPAWEPQFDGQTAIPEWNTERLVGQSRRVWDVMRAGEWLSLFEIQREIERTTGYHDSITGISARTRDYRKPRWGGHTVESRRRGDKSSGEWEYRLLVRGETPCA